MAVATSLLTTNGSATNATSYDTASISPTANRLVLATVSSVAGTLPTCSGASMTWVQAGTYLDAGTVRRITTFRALSSAPGSGALTFDFGGVSQQRAHWTVVEFSGVKQSGTNGSGAVVQTAGNEATGTNTGLTVTLGAFSHAGNATFGIVRYGADIDIVPGDGFTQTSEFRDSTAGELVTIQSEFKATNDTSVDWSWASTTGVVIGLAFEIAYNPIKTIAGEPFDSVKKVSSIARANLKKISGVI